MKKILALLALSAFSSVVFAQESTAIVDGVSSGSVAESNSQGGTGVGHGGSATTGPSTSSVVINYPTQPTETTQNVNSNLSGGTNNVNTNTDNITSNNTTTVDSTSTSNNTNNNTNNSTENITSNNTTTVTGETTSNVVQSGSTTNNIVSSGGTNNRTEVKYSGSYKTVPNVYAPPVGVTAPCIVGWSAGVSVIGVGVSAGNGVEDKECTNRENARMLHAFGEVKGAVSLLCQNKNVLKAMKDRCELAMASDAPQVPVTSAAGEAAASPVVITEEPKAERKHTRKKVGG